MRIAMFCSGRYPTPPAEDVIFAPIWITSFLADEMARRGHEVTLFGAKGSKSKGKVVDLGLPPLETHPTLPGCIDIRKDRVINFYEQIYISEIYRRAQKREFDIVHIHPVDIAINFAVNSSVPTVFTLHDPISCWRKFVYELYSKNKNINFVSISESQRGPSKKINYIDTIYNGIDIKKYKFDEKGGDYLFEASRVVPLKGFDLAVKVAQKSGLPLKIAGEILDARYWEEKLKPFIGGKISYEGMISPFELPKLYRKAKAFIFPIQWEEPFGLVMIEAMACGAPVVAFDRGSVKEVVKDGVTGFVIPPLNKKGEPNIEGMAEAVKKIDKIDRAACRKHVKDNFTLEKMVEKYEKVYEKIVKKNR
ncbi:glycosyltransferase family 4 protein [Patescibacteria group bacterium]|nr:glycosyltransferase family 4 protein [Patescibacteria group bacterium]MBU4579843.1 glycosyltransferase family 4 protein [Patescibacteria group bacterium]